MATKMIKLEHAADGIIEIIDNIISERLKRIDDTILCQVYKIYPDGSLDITVVPDDIHVITGVQNVLMTPLRVGDYVWVYRIGQNFTNSFVLYKPGKSVDFNQLTQNASIVYGAGGGSSAANVVIKSDEVGTISYSRDNGQTYIPVNIKGFPTVYVQNADYTEGTLTLSLNDSSKISIPLTANFVTIDTDQIIKGQKTFKKPIRINTKVDSDLYADIHANNISANRTFSLPDASGDLSISKCYDFTNNFQQEWIITHNMNKYPSVTSIRVYYDSTTGQVVKTEEVVGSVEYNTLNQLTITFATEIKGYAYLS